MIYLHLNSSSHPFLRNEVPIFYLKASAIFPKFKRRAAKTVLWKEQFHQHYGAHLIYMYIYLLIITIILLLFLLHLFSNASRMIPKKRRDKYPELIRNLSFSYIKKKMIQITGIDIDCNWKSWKLIPQANVFFFFSTIKRLVKNSRRKITMQL